VNREVSRTAYVGQRITKKECAKQICFTGITFNPNAYHTANHFAFLLTLVQLFGHSGAASVTYLPFFLF